MSSGAPGIGRWWHRRFSPPLTDLSFLVHAPIACITHCCCRQSMRSRSCPLIVHNRGRGRAASVIVVGVYEEVRCVCSAGSRAHAPHVWRVIRDPRILSQQPSRDCSDYAHHLSATMYGLVAPHASSRDKQVQIHLLLEQAISRPTYPIQGAPWYRPTVLSGNFRPDARKKAKEWVVLIRPNPQPQPLSFGHPTGLTTAVGAGSPRQSF